MDNSRTVDCINVGGGVFCEIVSFYSPDGTLMSTFDGEIFAIHLVLSQLLCSL